MCQREAASIANLDMKNLYYNLLLSSIYSGSAATVRNIMTKINVRNDLELYERISMLFATYCVTEKNNTS